MGDDPGDPLRRRQPPAWMMAPLLSAPLTPVAAAPPAAPVVMITVPVPVPAPIPAPVRVRPVARIWPGDAPVAEGRKIRRWDVPHWG